MDSRAAQTRDALLLSAAVVLGVLVPPALAIVGLPIAAAGIAGLAYRRRLMNVAAAIAIGVAAVAFMPGVAVAYVAPALVGIVFAIFLLPRVDVQWIGALLIGILGFADAAHEFLIMRARNLTPQAFVSQVVDSMSSTSTPAQVKQETTKLLLTLLPMAYFVTGLITAVAVILAIAWAAKRTNRTLKIPALAKLDLTPHVLWPFIIGVLALAASYGPLSYSSTLWAVGLNLVLCVSVLFALQGVGVVAGMLDRIAVGRGLRVWAWVALVVFDVFIPVVSFVGLLDFWVNFRRLPRDGATPPSPTTAMSDR